MKMSKITNMSGNYAQAWLLKLELGLEEFIAIWIRRGKTEGKATNKIFTVCNYASIKAPMAISSSLRKSLRIFD